MKNTLPKILLSCVLIILCEIVVLGKEWRSIVPLKSTRDDVERTLGAPEKTSYSASYYSLPDEIVVIDFQVACDFQCGLGWNVPSGTVVGIGVIPKGDHKKEEYLTPTSAFTASDKGTGFVYYTNEAEGLTIETYQSVVTLVEYCPKASEKALRCQRLENCTVELMPTFDEYGKIALSDEKTRLDNYSIQLNALLGRGVIEVRGPTKKDRAERMKSAARAKAYLVKKHKIEPERMFVFDGGYAVDSLTRLSLYSIGGLGTYIYFAPQSNPVTKAPNRRK